MAWGSKSNILSQSGSSVVSSTEEYTTAVSLNPGEVAHVEVDADNKSASPTDDLEVKLYANMTDSSADWDDLPIWSQTVEGVAAAQKLSFVVANLYQFRVGVAATGGTDNYNVVINYRKDGVSL